MYSAPLSEFKPRAYYALRSASSTLQLPEGVLKRAAALLSSTRRDSIHTAAACLLLASREYQVPVTLSEVVNAFKGSTDLKASLVVKEARRLFERGLAKPRYTPPERFLPRIASRLEGLSDERKASLIREASKLIVKAREQCKTGGRTPSAIAAAALYEASRRLGVRVSQEGLANAANVSVPSIRSAAQAFQTHIEKYVKPSAQAVQVTLGSYLGGVLAFEVAGPGEAPGLEGRLSPLSHVGPTAFTP